MLVHPVRPLRINGASLVYPWRMLALPLAKSSTKRAIATKLGGPGARHEAKNKQPCCHWSDSLALPGKLAYV